MLLKVSGEIRVIQKRQDTAIRRRQIVSAARKVIVKYGSEHVTIRRIAKEVGVSEGALYRHFKSKKDILSLLVNDIGNTLLADIERDSAASLNTMETMERIIRGHMSAVEQRKGIAFQVIAEIISLGDKGLNKKCYEVLNKYISRIREILSEGIKNGLIRQDIDVDAESLLFFGMVQGLVSIWSLSNYAFDIGQKYASLWTAFHDTIVKR